MSDHVIQQSYIVTVAVDTTTVAGFFVGPPGRVGRITGISAVAGTNITGSVGSVGIGNAADANAYATMSIPNTTAADRVLGTISTNYFNGVYPAIDPNTVIRLSPDGAPTAGDAVFYITIDWE